MHRVRFHGDMPGELCCRLMCVAAPQTLWEPFLACPAAQNERSAPEASWAFRERRCGGSTPVLDAVDGQGQISGKSLGLTIEVARDPGTLRHADWHDRILHDCADPKTFAVLAF